MVYSPGSSWSSVENKTLGAVPYSSLFPFFPLSFFLHTSNPFGTCSRSFQNLTSFSSPVSCSRSLKSLARNMAPPFSLVPFLPRLSSACSHFSVGYNATPLPIFIDLVLMFIIKITVFMAPYTASFASLPTHSHILTSLYSLSLSPLLTHLQTKAALGPHLTPRIFPPQGLCASGLYTYLSSHILNSSRNLFKGFLCTVADHPLTFAAPLRKCVQTLLCLCPDSLHRPPPHLPQSSLPPSFLYPSLFPSIV